MPKGRTRNPDEEFGHWKVALARQPGFDTLSYADTAGYRFKVDYDFDTAGRLVAAKDGNTGSLFYALSQADAIGRDTYVTFGSNVTEQRVYDPATLALTSIDTGVSRALHGAAQVVRDERARHAAEVLERAHVRQYFENLAHG